MLKKLLIFSLAVIMTAGFTSCGGETEAERERREALEELEKTQSRLDKTTSELASTYKAQAEAASKWQEEVETAENIFE